MDIYHKPAEDGNFMCILSCLDAFFFAELQLFVSCVLSNSVTRHDNRKTSLAEGVNRVTT